MDCPFADVCDLARIRLFLGGRDVGKLGQVEVPGLVEGQVGLIGIGEDRAVLQQLDGDLWGVEGLHQADQGVGLAKLCREAAVHLHLGHSWRTSYMVDNYFIFV